MRVAHLAPGVLAVLIVLGALAGGVLRARQMEAGAARALAPTLLPQKRLGTALQQAALDQPDLLPIYGSSELRRGGKERPAAVFRDEPTGFQVFQVGNGGESALNHLLELSALGDRLQGKKIVISFTPGPLLRDRDWRLYFRDNFAPLHAYELVFTSDVDPEIKRSVARRLLEFPRTLAGDPLLGFAVTHLAGDRFEDRVLYALARPLGVIETFILRLQDHWALLSYLRRHPNLLFRQPATPEPLDWARLLGDAARAENHDPNPFGFGHEAWQAAQQRLPELRGRESDSGFKRTMHNSGEWHNLDLLLGALKQWGAQPMLLSTPLSGAYYQYLGVSPEGRAAYYERLQQLARRYDVPLVNFADHDTDTTFVNDPGSHPSRKGWIYLDATLDAFYHSSGDQPLAAGAGSPALLPGDPAGAARPVRTG